MAGRIALTHVKDSHGGGWLQLSVAVDMHIHHSDDKAVYFATSRIHNIKDQENLPKIIKALERSLGVKCKVNTETI